MAECLVTGIAPTGDAAQISKMLSGSSLDESRLSSVTKASGQARLNAHAEHGGPSFSNASTIMTGSGGTGVPGVGRGHASLSASSHADVPDFLGGLPLIPRDQAEHFNVAIAEGRGLVMYKATPEEAPQVEAAFRSAGLRNVKIFKPKVTTPPT
ncbi:MAG TPA: hypothetical protein VJP85_11895 [Candidatus Baltobacteraceae bacterium]|nr:hypothetical protein [Candidatus Baltobacteraceae bacterium]